MDLKRTDKKITDKINIEKGYKNYNVLYFIYPRDRTNLEISINNIIPDTLSYDYSPNFSGQGTLGRMSPIQIYTGGSPKTYSFSLTMHEDALVNTNYDTLIEFVDAIKMLSYPTVDAYGIMTKPPVEFHIGSISGKGIVKTSINWKKPFRDGHYIMVEISFTITAEMTFPEPKMTIETTTEYIGEQVIYNERVRISEEEVSLLNSYKGSYDINTSISDFISDDFSEKDKQANTMFVREYFDWAEETLSRAYGNFESKYVNSELEGMLSDLSVYTDKLGEISTNLIGMTETTTPGELDDDLDNLLDTYIEFLDYYYDNVDIDMTRNEYIKAKEKIEIIVGQMKDLYRTVYGYASSD